MCRHRFSNQSLQISEYKTFQREAVDERRRVRLSEPTVLIFPRPFPSSAPVLNLFLSKIHLRADVWTEQPHRHGRDWNWPASSSSAGPWSSRGRSSRPEAPLSKEGDWFYIKKDWHIHETCTVWVVGKWSCGSKYYFHDTISERQISYDHLYINKT